MKEIIITSSVLILCIMLIRIVFKGKISSRLQYALWLLVALRLMIPASAQIYMAIGSIQEFRNMDLAEMLESRFGDMTERIWKRYSVRSGQTRRQNHKKIMVYGLRSCIILLYCIWAMDQLLNFIPRIV